MREWIVALALVLITPASAAAQSKPDGVTDTSFVEADGDRVIQLTAVAPAPPAAVWQALTSAEGWRRLGVQSAAVDFRVGGMIETNYRPEVPVGDRSNIKNEIVAYVPERLLAIRNVQAPPGFANAAELATTATVIELQPHADGTRVTLTGVGFRPGAAYDALFGQFRGGNRWTLAALAASFAAPPVSAEESAAADAKFQRKPGQ